MPQSVAGVRQQQRIPLGQDQLDILLCDAVYIHCRVDGQSRLDTIKGLLKAGANPDARHNFYEDAPMIFEGVKFPDVGRLLLEHGADIDARNNEGESGLLLAIKEDTDSRFFLQNGANVNIVDAEGRSPIYHATHAGCLQAVKQLVAYGADLFETYNERPGHYAVSLCDVAILCQYDPDTISLVDFFQSVGISYSSVVPFTQMLLDMDMGKRSSNMMYLFIEERYPAIKEKLVDALNEYGDQEQQEILKKLENSLIAYHGFHLIASRRIPVAREILGKVYEALSQEEQKEMAMLAGKLSVVSDSRERDITPERVLSLVIIACSYSLNVKTMPELDELLNELDCGSSGIRKPASWQVSIAGVVEKVEAELVTFFSPILDHRNRALQLVVFDQGLDSLSRGYENRIYRGPLRLRDIGEFPGKKSQEQLRGMFNSLYNRYGLHLSYSSTLTMNGSEDEGASNHKKEFAEFLGHVVNRLLASCNILQRESLERESNMSSVSSLKFLAARRVHDSQLDADKVPIRELRQYVATNAWGLAEEVQVSARARSTAAATRVERRWRGHAVRNSNEERSLHAPIMSLLEELEQRPGWKRVKPIHQKAAEAIESGQYFKALINAKRELYSFVTEEKIDIGVPNIVLREAFEDVLYMLGSVKDRKERADLFIDFVEDLKNGIRHPNQRVHPFVEKVVAVIWGKQEVMVR